jgi:EpsI family protein
MGTMDRGRPPAYIWVAGLLLVLAFLAAEALTPRKLLADEMPPMKLEASVPMVIKGWHVNPEVVPVLPDPTVEEKLNALYSQTLSRTYVRADGTAVMLSIAYGKNQNSESTAAHRPEFCYSVQGFAVERLGVQDMNVQGHQFQAVRLKARAGPRLEPITYWVTLGKNASIPGLDRKLQQLQFGLRGWIADGMLMRVSSLARSDKPQDLAEAYALQEAFLKDMAEVMSVEDRSRFFGS